MLVKDLIDFLESFDGESSIGLLVETETCGMYDIYEEGISFDDRKEIIKYTREKGINIDDSLTYDYYIR